MADRIEPNTETMEENKNEEQPQSFELNGKTYTQDELSYLVGLGEMGREVEIKYNTKLDRVYPEYTKATQQLKEYESKVREAEKKELELKSKAGEELSPEEIRRRAIAEAEEIGLVHTGNIKTFIQDFLEGRELLSDVKSLAEQASEKGITTTPQAILEYMEQEGFKNPNKAFNDMFSKELEAWEQKQVDSIKKPGLVTGESSSAGNKFPTDVKPTRENLDQLVAEALSEQL